MTYWSTPHVICATCKRSAKDCRSTCSSLQPMIDYLRSKRGVTTDIRNHSIDLILDVLQIIETERDMDKAIKKVKGIY